MNYRSESDTRRLPEWFKVRLPGGEKFSALSKKLKDHGLHTICEEARCPNRGECWTCGTATFLLLGPNCTRSCRYCSVETGAPAPPDGTEPEAVADTAEALGLKYIVITSVTRDDLEDGGAEHFARTIERLRSRRPEARIEVLAPDFQGNERAVEVVAEQKPYVFGHNIETVEALFPIQRPQGDFSRSLKVLESAGKFDKKIIIKSGLMLGLGETSAQVRSTLRALRGAGVDRVTLGQYLQPSRELAPVDRFVPPEEFRECESTARDMGFKWVKAGPSVRSSYHAEQDEN